MISLDHIFQLKTPPARLNYSSEYDDLPIVIDNGSYQFRIGYSTNSNPLIQFKNVIGRSKSKRDGIVVGDYIEDFSSQIKYAFDRNVVVNYEVQETVFDYAFDQMNLDSLVDHPIVINEPLCNPNICRQQMSELLFEGYNVPSITYYVDGLASYAYNNPDYLESFATDTALIISFGYQTVHLLSLLNGRLESKLCRKVNVGGSQLDALMSRLLQLKYPCHANYIDLRVGEHLQKKCCRVALNYRQEMLKWKDHNYSSKYATKIMLPFKKYDKLTQEQLEEKKRQQSARGKEIYNKRNQEKLVMAQENLSNLKDLLTGRDYSNKTLKSMGFDNHQEVMSEIKVLETTIENLQNKISGIDNSAQIKVPVQDKDKYDLINVSDDELDEEEIKLKQRQIMMKAAAIRREQIRLMKELQRKKILAAVSKLEETRDEDFPLWVMNLRHRRQALMDTRMKKRPNVNSIALPLVQSPVSARAGSSIGLDERRQPKKKRPSGSGDVVFTPSQYDESSRMSNLDELSDEDDESDTEQKQLTQLEILLSQYDPEFTKDGNNQLKVNLDEYYRIRLTTETLRVPEVLFRPYLIGYEDAGLGEVLHGIFSGEYLAHLPQQHQQQYSGSIACSGSNASCVSVQPQLCQPQPINEQLAERIFITGSLADLPNLSSRIFQEIRQALPVEVPDPDIKFAENPQLDSWRGACKLAQHPQFESMGVSKEAYDEMGHDYIQEHPISNLFYSPLTNIEEMIE